MSYLNKIKKIIVDNNTELLSFVLKDVSKVYDIEYEELETKYIKPLDTFKRKKNTNKKGKLNGYSMFLKDKDVDRQIKAKYKDGITFVNLTREKANIWDVMSKKDKADYSQKAQEYNEKLKNKINKIDLDVNNNI